MTQITSHILDTSLGKPAQGVSITLSRQKSEQWNALGSASTNQDGRVGDFTGSSDTLPAGVYKLTFQLRDYYARQNVSSFYPYAEVVFEIKGDGQHYHVPLLLNPFGYSTYRGCPAKRQCKPIDIILGAPPIPSVCSTSNESFRYA